MTLMQMLKQKIQKPQRKSVMSNYILFNQDGPTEIKKLFVKVNLAKTGGSKNTKLQMVVQIQTSMIYKAC